MHLLPYLVAAAQVPAAHGAVHGRGQEHVGRVRVDQQSGHCALVPRAVPRSIQCGAAHRKDPEAAVCQGSRQGVPAGGCGELQHVAAAAVGSLNGVVRLQQLCADTAAIFRLWKA